jgi:hypothetical protein
VLIFDENIQPTIFDSIYTPTNIDFFYIFDLEIQDFTLAPLYALEEVICPAFKIKIGNFEFFLPTNYYILVFSEETSQVDSIKISDLTNTNFSVVMYGEKMSMIKPICLHIIDYLPEYRFVVPFLTKNQMLCHPIAPETWINISGHDQYNKYLKKTYVNDLIT